MHATDIPTRLPLPFAAAAGGGYIRGIPVASQIGIDDGAASLTDGFVPLNATPIGAGGIPPDIKDMNGILFEISGWARWVAAGGPVFYDAAFATAISGYPKGGVVASATLPGVLFVSTADSNTTDPEGGSPAGWQLLVPAVADNATTLAGVDAAKFVTPAGLAYLRATTPDILAGTAAGKFLTPSSFYGARALAADIVTGTDDHKYLTPLGLTQAFGASPDTIYFPGGLQMKFGIDRVTHSGEGGVLVNFPTPFPNACLVVTATEYTPTPGDTTNDMWAHVSTRTASGFYYNYGASSSGNVGYGFDWIAIGN